MPAAASRRAGGQANRIDRLVHEVLAELARSRLFPHDPGGAKLVLAARSGLRTVCAIVPPGHSMPRCGGGGWPGMPAAWPVRPWWRGPICCRRS